MNTQIAIQRLSFDEAKALTAQIRASSEELYDAIKRAHDGYAWAAIGYPDWKTYVETEFGMSKQHSYRLVDYAGFRDRLLAENDKNGDVSSTKSTEASHPRETPIAIPTERKARAIAALPPEKQVEAWKGAVQKAGGKAPTEAHIADAAAQAKPATEPSAASDAALVRIAKVCGKNVGEAVQAGGVVEQNAKELTLWAKQNDGTMAMIEQLVIGSRWTPSRALRLLDEMVDEKTRIEDIIALCIAGSGTWGGTIGGFEISVRKR